MSKSAGAYRPDFAVPPGWVLEEMIEAQEMSHAEFARRCGRSPKLVSEIIAGKAPIEPETAIQFERVLGMDASVWLNIEADYKLHRAKVAEGQRLQQEVAWYKKFSVKELVALGAFPKPENEVDGVQKLLSFFGVANVEAWERRFRNPAASYRHSPSIKSSLEALTTWLRLGEIKAEEQECNAYDRRAFLSALREIRGLTLLDSEEFLPYTRALCNQAGVAFVIVPPLPKAALSGAARWLTPRKALIQQSVRHLANDHFWFTFFHEAAHILYHSKKDVFIDEVDKEGTELEKEANDWATNFLVPRRDWNTFVATRPQGKAAVLQFADKQGIAPGIVVGMLQHAGIVPWKHLNDLKQRYKWHN